MYLPRGFEMPLVRMAARAVATVRKGGAWALPCGRVTYEAVAAAWKGGELGPAPFSRGRAQRRGKGGSLAQRPSAVPVLSRVGRPVLCAGCGAEQEVVPKGYPSPTRLGRGPGAEEWSEELAMGGTRVPHGVPVWQG